MTAIAARARHELIGLYGVVERNWYLVKRYALWEIAFFLWTIANTLSIVFISRSEAVKPSQVDYLTTYLLIGAVIWAYLGIIFEILTETFMAPLSRPVHLIGMGLFAIGYGVVRASLVFGAIAAIFSLHLGGAAFGTALIVLAIASVSFIGIGMMTAVLPLISPEKGTQLGFMMQGVLLVVSGVYVSVDKLPEWMQAIATISPATYALEGIRAAIIDGASVTEVWPDIWPLLIIGVVSIPLGLWVFRRGEVYAKKHGKLKRSG
jgi:ABC-2 type transport system permease protein